MEAGKPNIGERIPSRYKVHLSDVDKRVAEIEKRLNIVPNIPKSFENADTDTIEYRGYLIRRDLSSGLYTVHEVNGGKQVIPGNFNKLQMTKDATDLRVSAQKLSEHMQYASDLNPRE